MTDQSPLLEARLRLALTDFFPVLSVSDTIQSLLGFSPESLLNGDIPLKKLIHPEDQDIADDLFSATMEHPSGTFNIRLRQVNGRIRCLRGQYEKRLDEDGRTLILELLLQDANSLYQHTGDQPLMANFRALMENTDDFIFFKDRNHVFTGASQTLVAITDPAEHWTDLIGKTDYDVFPEEYADTYYQLEKQVFAGIPVAHEVQEILTKDGRKGWVDNRKYPIHDAAGNIIGLFGIARDITEKKRVDEALAESEQRFRTIFEQVPLIAVQGYDRERQVIFWNAASEALYGYTREQALGRRLEELIVPEPMRATVVRLVDEWAAGSTDMPTAEFSLQGADGSPVEVFSSHVMLRNKHGEPEMYCIDLDISERKRAAVALQREQQFSKLVIDKLPGIFYLYTYPECRLVLWNKQHETLLGYEASEMAGRHVADWHLPEARAAVMDAVDEAMRTGQSSIEAPLLAKDGHPVYFALTGVKFETTGQAYLMGVGTNITERKQMEEALRISEQRHRLLADNASDVIWTMDLEGHFTYISPSVERLRGYTSAEVIRQTLEEALMPESIPIAMNGMARNIAAVQAGLPIPEFRGELEQPCKDGSTVWTEVTTTGMRNSAGEFVGILGVSRDITARKKMEEQVRLLAFHDPLTGLPNRRLLSDRLNHAMVLAVRHSQRLAVAYLDLDGFKDVNDRHGHEIGDKLLIALASRMKQTLRDSDTLARLGGDEFVIVLVDLAEVADCVPMLNRLLAATARPVDIDGLMLEVTASIGVTFYPQTTEVDADQLLRQSDQAMYQAKLAGKSRYQLFAAV